MGIDRDVRILSEAIASWREPPAFSRYRSIHPLSGFLGHRGVDETIIFLERVTARWLRRARRYLLIPNQERYPERLVPLLRSIDHILCKSRHAVEIFAKRHPSVHYLGFTSEDRALPDSRPDYARFFHLAGGSSLKGTAALLEAWRRHPEWPELTIIQHSRQASQTVPPNVNLITRYLPDTDLRALQNSCGIHLCPSLSEGWGHYIVEGMSCSAVVLATNGPPMNELVQPDRGVLVPYSRSEPRKLGFNFYVDPSALEVTISDLVALPGEAKQQLGHAARQWFEDKDGEFRANLQRLLPKLLPDSGARAILDR